MESDKKATPAELAESLRQLTHFLSGLWSLETNPQSQLCHIIERIVESAAIAHELPHVKAAVQAEHVLRQARIIIGRDRDVLWCGTSEEAVELAERRMALAYGECGKLLEYLAAELLVQPQLEADKKRTVDKNSQPTSPDVQDLCFRLRKGLSEGKSQLTVAREFTGETSKSAPKAHSLLRQARRYRHLWELG